MMRGFVVTGTDTGIGKTLVAAALAGHLRAAYWKPVQAGTDEETDSAAVARLTPPGAVKILPEAYCLTTPCSPHQAAAIDGVEIDPARLRLPQTNRPLVVEGAGGVLVPLSDDRLFANLFADWGLPVVLVARTGLGTINHSLLSLEALRARKIEVQGILFSGDANAESERIICLRGTVRHLGHLPRLQTITAQTLADSFARHADLAAFA